MCSFPIMWAPCDGAVTEAVQPWANGCAILLTAGGGGGEEGGGGDEGGAGGGEGAVGARTVGV